MAPEERIKRLINVVRFGPDLFPGAEFQALLYHAERTLTWGDDKDSDASSYRQIVGGIYSRKQSKWVRGGSGLRKTAAASANRGLERRGVLVRIGARSANRGHEATRYEINWKRFDELLAAALKTRPIPLVRVADKPLSVKRTSPCSPDEHTEYDRTQKESSQGDIDCLTTNRKGGDSSSGYSLPASPTKQYPRLRLVMGRYMAENPQAPEDYPSDRAVVDTMEAARLGGGSHVSEEDVVRCLVFLYEERGLRPGTKHGPRHFSWFPTVVQDYFDKLAVREMVSNPTGFEEWQERNEARADREEAERYARYASVFDSTA